MSRGKARRNSPRKPAKKNPPLPAKPAGPVFTEADLDRALDSLELLFQDNEWPEGEVTLEELRLVEALHSRGITRALAVYLLNHLIEAKVFREGRKFVEIQEYVSFAGEQRGGPTKPNRELHTSRDKWYAYLRVGRETTTRIDQRDTSHVIWYHGDRSYSVDRINSVNVGVEEHNALKAFLDSDTAKNTRDLQNAGVNNPSRTLTALAKKFPAGAFRMPSRRNDGYLIRVKSNAAKK